MIWHSWLCKRMFFEFVSTCCKPTLSVKLKSAYTKCLTWKFLFCFSSKNCNSVSHKDKLYSTFALHALAKWFGRHRTVFEGHPILSLKKLYGRKTATKFIKMFSVALYFFFKWWDLKFPILKTTALCYVKNSQKTIDNYCKNSKLPTHTNEGDMGK